MRRLKKVCVALPLSSGGMSAAATALDVKIRRIEGMEFHPMVVLEVDAFADRVQRTPVPTCSAIHGRRSSALRVARSRCALPRSGG
jgi:hypothetical protein